MPPVCPPRTADGVRRRLKPRAPYHPREPQGLTAHAPAALGPGAGTMTPATRGKGARAKLWSRNGQPGTTPPRTLPEGGGVWESRPVKGDHGGAQAGAAKRRAPVRGRSGRNGRTNDRMGRRERRGGEENGASQSESQREASQSKSPAGDGNGSQSRTGSKSQDGKSHRNSRMESGRGWRRRQRAEE